MHSQLLRLSIVVSVVGGVGGVSFILACRIGQSVTWLSFNHVTAAVWPVVILTAVAVRAVVLPRWPPIVRIVFPTAFFVCALVLAIFFVVLWNRSTRHANGRRYLIGREREYIADALIWAKGQEDFTGDAAAYLESRFATFVKKFPEIPLYTTTDLAAVEEQFSVTWLLLTASATACVEAVAIGHFNKTLRVFVSATTADLKSFRKQACEALKRHNQRICPISQDYLPTDFQTIVQKLKKEIRDCDAMICLVGIVYGREPDHQPKGTRRSYTQLEYEIAKELRKPVFVFLGGEKCSYDPHADEPEELRQLQATYRGCLRQKPEDRGVFESQKDLECKLSQIDFSQLG
jgi:hypothetical protein